MQSMLKVIFNNAACSGTPLGAASMIVCLCKNVSNRVIEDSIEDGATTIEEVGRACGAGTDCGGCHCELEEMLAVAACERSGTHRLPVLQPNVKVA